MADLSADQLTDIRADIGDDGTVFSDAELNRLYTRASSDYNTSVVLALRQLLVNASKLNDYRVAQSSENKSQVFAQIQKLLDYWESVAQRKQQIKIVGMAAVPPRLKDTPNA